MPKIPDNVRKLDTGKFQARYVHPATGKRIARTFARSSEAGAWLKAQATDIARGEWHDPDAGKITVAAWGERWLGAHHVAPRTREGYEMDLRVHINPAMGALPLSSVTPDRVQAWLGERRATGHLSAASHAYRTLSVMMNAAVDAGRIPKSPCRVKGAAQAPTSNTVNALNLEEVWAVHDAMDEEYRAWVLLSAYGGPRWGEGAALTVGDINFEASQVVIDKAVRYVKGGYELDRPKTAAGTRVIGLPPFVMDSLAHHVATYTDGQARSLLFTTKRGRKVLSDTNFRARYWKPATEGLTWSPRIHDLRHTFATLAIKAGADAKTLQRMMGHARASMTMDLYGKWMATDTNELAAAMSKLSRPA